MIRLDNLDIKVGDSVVFAPDLSIDDREYLIYADIDVTKIYTVIKEVRWSNIITIESEGYKDEWNIRWFKKYTEPIKLRYLPILPDEMFCV